MISYKDWRQMTTKQISEKFTTITDWWKYITAIRGPDDPNFTMKRIFTTFIRGMVPNCLADDIGEFESLLGRIDELDDIKMPKLHWLDHILNALRAISYLDLDENMEGIVTSLMEIADKMEINFLTTTKDPDLNAIKTQLRTIAKIIAEAKI